MYRWVKGGLWVYFPYELTFFYGGFKALDPFGFGAFFIL